MRHLCLVAATALLCVSVRLPSQEAAPQAAGPKPARACPIQHVMDSDDNRALADHRYERAAELFGNTLKERPTSAAARVGLIRALLGEGKTDEALELATAAAATTGLPPTLGSMFEDALGEARFRRGEVVEAARAFTDALALDPCVARVHSDLARFQSLNGNFLSARKQLDLAHSLSPEDTEITRLWEQTHDRKSNAELLESETKKLASKSLPADQRANLEQGVAYRKAVGVNGCQSAQPIATAKLKLEPLTQMDQKVYGMGLDLEINGKRRRLQVDTGASGLILTRAGAAALGLTPEAELRMGGFGDQGSVRALVAHVDTLRLGGLEFHNCKVDVLDSRRAMETAGLIGTDVFGDWLVTVDPPMRELRLATLPARPGEAPADTASSRLLTDGAEGTGEEDAESGIHDRYIAPEMKDWTTIYRSGHDLILPVRANDQPPRLFIIDTGSFSGLLSPALAKRLGNVVETDTIITGISGEIAHVYTVDRQVQLEFGGARQPVRGISVIDLGRTGHGGVDVSGFLGYTALGELALSIDYRDNLIKLTFDPKHGFHSNGSMQY